MAATQQIMRKHNKGIFRNSVYLFRTCLTIFLAGLLLSVFYITFPLALARPLCNEMVFNSGSPAVIDLPPFNVSHVQIELPDPNYFLDYQEIDDNGNLTFTICVRNSIKPHLVCMSFNARMTAICRPSDYPQCLPAAFDSGRQGGNPTFGVSIINNESNVTVYHIKAIYPSEAYSETLTWQDSNDLNSIWFAGLNCSSSWLLVAGIVLGGCTVVLCPVLCLPLAFCASYCLYFRRTRKRRERYESLCSDLEVDDSNSGTPGPSPPTPLVPQPLDHPSLHTYIEPHVAHRWERFAINLGVTVAMMESIRKDCSGSCEVACKQVLIRWLAGEEGTGRDPRTWSTVLKAVRETGFPDVADELQKKLSLVDEDA